MTTKEVQAMLDLSYDGQILAEPPEEHIKENKDGGKFLPISYVQRKLYDLYQGHTRFSLLREQVLKGGIMGVGRLEYKHPVSGEWLHQDGSASVPHRGNMRLDFPSLGSQVLLNCAKKIGPCFGQNLNRDREDAPIDDEGQEPTIEAVRLLLLIENAASLEELAGYKKEAQKHGLMKEYMNTVKELSK